MAAALLARHLEAGGPSVHVNTLVATLKASDFLWKRMRYPLKTERRLPFARQP